MLSLYSKLYPFPTDSTALGPSLSSQEPQLCRTVSDPLVRFYYFIFKINYYYISSPPPCLFSAHLQEALGACAKRSSYCNLPPCAVRLGVNTLDDLKTLGSVYGNSGVQSRRKYLSFPSPSHAFPRDLRRPHPRNHGGDGEAIQDRVPPGQRGTNERPRNGKKGAGIL